MQMTFREHLLRGVQWLTRTNRAYLHDLPPGAQEEAVRGAILFQSCHCARRRVLPPGLPEPSRT